MNHPHRHHTLEGSDMKYAIVVFDVPFPELYDSKETFLTKLAKIKEVADSIEGTSMLAANCLLFPLSPGQPQLFPDLPKLVRLLHYMQEWHVKYHMLGLEEIPSTLLSPQP